ncbi:GATA transcription factor 4-like [Impatiens glandulifera]|uniref:GATA transcription factor 4-like n=1 Tax=Impatiens glandulifera TaxID=253017 RepID=UPI001FB178AD|nr:GATA transcription factor 4-like [Impatiens glandulifera]
MDIYGLLPAPESFPIDDLLDFTNADLFSSSTTTTAGAGTGTTDTHFTPSYTNINPTHKTQFTDFTDDLCLPNDDVAELEWLSNFVDDSFTDFPINEQQSNMGNNYQQPISTFHSRSRTKRSRATSTSNGWVISSEHELSTGKSIPSPEQQDLARRCTHCASEKTPQWRTGPLGPKTLCNACGVRYKSGRLVPEYRPAASPTFVLTQHSNSHRKVMELRRQKEIVKQEQNEQQLFHHHHFEQYHHHHQQQKKQGQEQGRLKNFEVC